MAPNFRWFEDVAQYLATSGFGTYAGTDHVNGNIFAHKMPATPINAVALIAYYPGTWAMAFGAKPFKESPRFRLEVRNTDDGAGWDLSYGIYSFLGQLFNVYINGVFYQQFEPVQSPFLLERDQNERAIFATNYEVWKELSS